MLLFGRVREPDEMAGMWRQLLLTKATDPEQFERGQDGGFVSAMLTWLMRSDSRRRWPKDAGSRPGDRCATAQEEVSRARA